MLIIEDETHFLFHCQINLKLRELTDNNGENKIKQNSLKNCDVRLIGSL